MQAIRRHAKTNARGELVLSELGLKEGMAVEVIVLLGKSEGNHGDLLNASESSLDFWDNPIDDQAWNDA